MRQYAQENDLDIDGTKGDENSKAFPIGGIEEEITMESLARDV